MLGMPTRRMLRRAGRAWAMRRPVAAGRARACAEPAEMQQARAPVHAGGAQRGHCRAPCAARREAARPPCMQWTQ